MYLNSKLIVMRNCCHTYFSALQGWKIHAVTLVVVAEDVWGWLINISPQANGRENNHDQLVPEKQKPSWSCEASLINLVKISAIWSSTVEMYLIRVNIMIKNFLAKEIVVKLDAFSAAPRALKIGFDVKAKASILSHH
jgi:hypothetical protein